LIPLTLLPISHILGDEGACNGNGMKGEGMRERAGVKRQGKRRVKGKGKGGKRRKGRERLHQVWKHIDPFSPPPPDGPSYGSSS